VRTLPDRRSGDASVNWYAGSDGWYELSGNGGMTPWRDEEDSPTAPPGWSPPTETDAADTSASLKSAGAPAGPG